MDAFNAGGDIKYPNKSAERDDQQPVDLSRNREPRRLNSCQQGENGESCEKLRLPSMYPSSNIGEASDPSIRDHQRKRISSFTELPTDLDSQKICERLVCGMLYRFFVD